MKITGISTKRIKIPLHKGEKWSGGTRYSAPSLIIKIETDDGLEGIGESVGPTIPVIQTIVEKEFASFVLGRDPLELESILHKLQEYCLNWSSIGNYGIAGIEMALLDLRAKIYNTPLFNLLGGLYRPEVEFAGYIFIDSPLNNVREAEKLVNSGFRELKMKAGRDVEQDVARVAAVREAVGPKVKIRIDPNQAWDVKTAIRTIRRMEKYDLQMVEQPTPATDLKGMAEVARAVDVPITADEACATFEDALRLIDARACSVFTIYPSEAGGILKARQIVELANSANIWCLTGTWAETGLGTLANVHLVASSRNFPFANDTHFNFMTGDILTQPLKFENARLKVPVTPGLGATISNEKLDFYSQDESREMVFYDPLDSNFQPAIGKIM